MDRLIEKLDFCSRSYYRRLSFLFLFLITFFTPLNGYLKELHYELSENLIEALIARGELNLLSGKYDLAEKDWEKALEETNILWPYEVSIPYKNRLILNIELLELVRKNPSLYCSFQDQIISQLSTYPFLDPDYEDPSNENYYLKWATALTLMTDFIPDFTSRIALHTVIGLAHYYFLKQSNEIDDGIRKIDKNEMKRLLNEMSLEVSQ